MMAEPTTSTPKTEDKKPAPDALSDEELNKVTGGLERINKTPAPLPGVPHPRNIPGDPFNVTNC
jgi:bacteriocin-like protein